jgi:signal transduction histidine kinase
MSQGIVGWAVRERQPVRVGNVEADPRYILITPGTQSVMAAPLVAGGRVNGVVSVDSPRSDAFSGDDLRLLTTLAGQLATIFEKARLDAELAEHATFLEQRVTERTHELSVANEQLQELDHLKDQFVSNVSHELRTPLANLKLYLSLLERGKPEKRAEYMQTLHREQQRLDNMIEDLLDLSRLDQGMTHIQPVPTDLSLLLSQLIADRTALSAEHQLVLDYQLDDALPLALIDPVMLTEVITNLVGNAINYTPADGTVTVSTAVREDAGQTWVTFTVQDNGLGISARDMPHLFERFYRGEVGRKASAPGTGLGLAISQEIVEKMGGRITVESEPGHGAAFTVWLKPAD